LELHPLTRFFRTYGGTSSEEFLGIFPGAFLLIRFKGGAPSLAHLPPEGTFKVTMGASEDCGLEFDGDPTLDEEHAIVAYHVGFSGWTIEDLETSFGTHVDAGRIIPKRPTLLQDRNVVKPGGGLTELQFYKSETFYTRMKKAGITRSLSRRKIAKKLGEGKPAIPGKPRDDETSRMLKAQLGNQLPTDDDEPTTRYKKPS